MLSFYLQSHGWRSHKNDLSHLECRYATFYQKSEAHKKSTILRFSVYNLRWFTQTEDRIRSCFLEGRIRMHNTQISNLVEKLILLFQIFCLEKIQRQNFFLCQNPGFSAECSMYRVRALNW